MYLGDYVIHVGSKEAGMEDLIRKVTFAHVVPSHSSARILRDAVVSCTAGRSECFPVLMPMGSIDAEKVRHNEPRLLKR